MKTLNFVLIAILILSCSPDDQTTDEHTKQDHWKVNYRSECRGQITGFLHVSNEEYEKAKKNYYWIDNEGCYKLRIKDMSGIFDYYIFHSASRPCREH